MSAPTAGLGAPAVRWDADLGAFVVTGYDEASAVLRGGGWSSDPANAAGAPDAVRELPTGLMLFRDPPDHTRLRRLVAPAFAARAVEGLRPRVGSIVEACLEGLGAPDPMGDDGPARSGGDAPVDLVADYAYLVPLAVIAELLDVGVEGAQVFLEQTPRLVRMLEVDAGPDDLAEAVAAALEITMFLTPILAERRGAGAGDDFVSALLATPELTLDEVLATCILLLAAGHETTANLIATGTLALLRQPDQVAHLLAEPARAVEELIRRHGPVKLIGRTATAEHDLGGLRVRPGDRVLLMVDRADRDPRRWTDPERLDLRREGPGHLGFGTGIHFCLGAALARLEAGEALTRLFRRYPDLRLADGPVRWRESSTFHAVDALPVRLGRPR